MSRQLNYKLQAEDRLILYLKNFTNYIDEPEMPYGITQSGIGRATSSERSHISHIIKDLEERALIESKKMHVSGGTKRRNTYFLTPKGYKCAGNLEKGMLEWEILAVEKDDTSHKTKVKELDSYLDYQPVLIDVALVLTDDGILDLETLKKTKTPITKKGFFTFEGNDLFIKEFYGREKELDAVSHVLEQKEPGLLIITGMVGIGKTTFITKACSHFKEKKDILWHDIHEWDSQYTIYEKLATFLFKIGKPQLRNYLKHKDELNLKDMEIILEKSLKNLDAVLIFDDFQKLDMQLLPIFTPFLEILKKSRMLKIVILGRQIPMFYDPKKLKIKNTVEMELKGLNKTNSRKLINILDLDNGDFEKIHGLTEGHPLFLSMIQTIDKSMPERELEKYIEKEVRSKLNDDERKILDKLSVFRYPVSIDVLSWQIKSYDVIDDLVEKSLLKEVGLGIYDMHDLLRKIFYESQTKAQKEKYHKIAGEYYLSDKRPLSKLEAIFHKTKANEFNAAIGIVNEHSDSLIKSGYSHELANYIETILSESGETDLPIRMKLISIMADCSYNIGELDRALESYEVILSNINVLAEKDVVAKSYLGVGLILLRKHKLDEARSNLEKALENYRKLKDEKGIGEAYYHIGVTYERQGALEKAHELFKKCEEIALENKDDLTLARAYNSYGRVLENYSDEKNAFTYLKKATKILERSPETIGLAKSYIGLAVSATKLIKDDEAIRYFQKSIDIAKKYGDLRILAFGHYNLALLHKRDFKQATNDIKIAIEIFGKIQDKRMIGLSHQIYGIIEHNRKNWNQAFNHIEKSIEILQEIEDMRSLANTRYEYGLMLWDAGEKAKAKVELKKCQDLLKEIGQQWELKEVEEALEKMEAS